MIRCFLVINNFGKPRLMKFYERLTNEERQVRISSGGERGSRSASSHFDVSEALDLLPSRTVGAAH